MSTDRTLTTRRTVAVVVVLAFLALIVAVGLLLQERVPGNMGTGFLGGAAAATAGALVMVWRATRRPADATTFERSWTQTGDERDDSVLTRALAVLGLLAPPLTGVAAITIALGAAVEMVLTLLIVAQVLVGAAAFVVVNRRS
ncbi:MULTISPECIES: hypothetical protein [unclassified Actinotalea]|uniref:hypothetical protein n=1 Tax=unclassified Actinotalea TaxID=2638618 RepID=UPI0015F39FD1|nr:MULTISPECIES: hypothetical protein [unclassified Actinotalea]